MEGNQGNKGATNYTLPHLINLYQRVEKNQSELYPKLYSSFKKLDFKACGITSGELIVVASPPAMGRRPFVLSMIMKLKNDYHNNPVKIRYFSLELSAQTLFKYFLTNFIKKPLFHLENDTLKAERKQNFSTVINGLLKHSLLVDEEKFEDYLDLIVRIRHDQIFHKSEVYVIDSLQLLGECKDSVRETDLCLKALKQIAKEFDVLIILISRISRSIEKRKKRIPKMSYLCELGKFDKYADHIFMLHRPEYYGFMENKKGRSQSGLMKIFGWNMVKNTKYTHKMRFKAGCQRVEEY